MCPCSELCRTAYRCYCAPDVPDAQRRGTINQMITYRVCLNRRYRRRNNTVRFLSVTYVRELSKFDIGAHYRRTCTRIIPRYHGVTTPESDRFRDTGTIVADGANICLFIFFFPPKIRAGSPFSPGFLRYTNEREKRTDTG